MKYLSGMKNKNPRWVFEFLNEFQNTLDRINLNAYYASNIHGDSRSATLKKFPCEVIYRIDEIDQKVRIIGIIHQHRDPNWFRQRL